MDPRKLWAALAVVMTGYGCREAPAPGGPKPSSAVEAAVDPLAPPADLAGPPAGATRSDTGLASVVLRAGAGARKPAAQDRVSVHYTSWLSSGAVYASTRKRGAPAAFRVSEASPGLQEGLSSMVEGEQRRLWIPAALATGSSEVAKPPGALVTDVELLKVVEGRLPAPAPPDLASPPSDAERTESGLVSRQLKAPTSSGRAGPYDRVRIAYVGWDEHGKEIDSSAPRGPSVEATLTHGFPGFRQALALLRAGERRRFWMPAALAYESYPGTVKGPLVYDIELFEIVRMPAPPPVPKDVAHVPRGAIRLPSGVAYRVLKRGTGTVKPGPEGAVDVHYSYWTSDGTLRNSTLPNGRPQRAELEDRDLPPGLAEVVADMVPGERRRLWVPEALGFPGKRPWTGPLVFDVELVGVYQGKARVDWVEPDQP